ncbi:Phosphotransferase enzyme family protein [Actinoalloteichus hoggarensis]|uniref:Phosphotransferase enzyme family protein n=2 Tax=Actinoalloteichus hoggarensis TaxID=1470176 RepID=A0A221W634_9PSEU|nr:Phosphotransferase enzyme family protein [Actinoalloteichus hoggarensis]
MTPDEIADRTAKAMAAAIAAGRDLGLTVTDPVVLHDMFSVVVHLAPAPVVVRVPVVLPRYVDAEFQSRRQQDELDVVAWLAEQAVPVIPPSPLVPREPVRWDGFSMTFWQLVATDSGVVPDYVHNAGLVPDLHAALRDYPGELPFLSAAEPRMVRDGLADLESRPDLLAPDDLDRARREWAVLEPLVSSRAAFEGAFPGIDLQPVHGDAPAYNIVPTDGGVLYSDFELVTFGPVEWDLAAFGPECESAYDAAARGRGLRSLDDRVLRFVNAVGRIRTIACLPLCAQLPLLLEPLRADVERWRSMPFAGGVLDVVAGD